jgi:hypothetical protein
VERLLAKLDDDMRSHVLDEYNDLISLHRDFHDPDEAGTEVDDTDGFQSDFDDPGCADAETGSGDDYADDVYVEEPGDDEVSIVISYGDDLDKVSPWEYETETERRVRENKTIITEEEYFRMDKPVNGWRNATIINEGQIDFYINVNVERKYMLMLVYKLSEIAGEKVTWYSSADMEKYIVFEKKRNTYMEHLKETELKDLYEKEPRVFREPYIAFGDLFDYIYLDD